MKGKGGGSGYRKMMGYHTVSTKASVSPMQRSKAEMTLLVGARDPDIHCPCLLVIDIGMALSSSNKTSCSNTPSPIYILFLWFITGMLPKIVKGEI